MAHVMPGNPDRPESRKSGGNDARAGFRRHIVFALCLVALIAVFGRTLVELARYAAHSQLYSYILLIPFISGYLLHLQRGRLRFGENAQRAWAIPVIAAGMAAFAVPCILAREGLAAGAEDRLSMLAFAFVTLLIGAGWLAYGGQAIRQAAFPLMFLYLITPLPFLVENGLSILMQRWSADASYAFLLMAGTPVYREDMILKLPGLTLEVAEECSGIRSTLVLFITSLLAGYMFLRAPWRRTVLALAVLPIAVLRNSLRIVMIALLTIGVDPEIIKGPLHRRGGTPFFVLSLVPLFAILLVFRSTERKQARPTAEEDR